MSKHKHPGRDPIGAQKRLLYLIAIISISVSLVGAIMYFGLYKKHIEEQREWLLNTAQSQARLIEAVARFDEEHNIGDYHKTAAAATLSQIIDAHEQYKGFGETGEFTLARREGDQIVFVLRHRHYDVENPKAVPLNSNLAEPMRLALSGKSGTVIGLDYRGEKVLAAYAHVEKLDLGIVAKMDFVEVRSQFVWVGMKAGIAAIILILVGSLLFIRIVNPLIMRLQENEEDLSKAQQIAHLGSWNYNILNNKLVWSDEVYRIFGVGPIGFDTTFEEFMKSVHPDDRAMVENATSEALNNGKTYSIDHRIVRPDGAELIVHEQAEVYFDENGKAIRMIGTVQDITERKKAEASLLESEERFHQISASAQDAIIMMDHEENISYWNNAAQKIFGYSRSETIGKNLHDVIAPDMYREKYLKGLKKFKETGRGHIIGKTNEIMAIRKDRKEIPVELSLSVVKIKGKWNAIGIIRDITERKRIEDELAEERRNLENTVKTRTEELHKSLKKIEDTRNREQQLHNELMENYEVLQKAELARDAMSHMIVHDLNNPMAVIMGNVQLMQYNVSEGIIDKESFVGDLQLIRNATDEMSSLTNSILDVSKLEAGDMPVNLTTVNAQDLTESIYKQHAPQASKKGIHLSMEAGPDTIIARADKDLLSRVIQNLLTNALKFAPAKAKVTVSVKEIEGNVVFCVANSGTEIPEQYRDKIFDKYFQIEIGRKRKKYGVGLGLTFCKMAVEAMGGKIWVENQQGKGASFKVALEASDA